MKRNKREAVRFNAGGRMRQRLFKVYAVLALLMGVVLAVGAGGVSHAALVNGTFDAGLSGWTTGAAQVESIDGNNAAVMLLDADGVDVLWQAGGLAPGAYTLEFDVRGVFPAVTDTVDFLHAHLLFADAGNPFLAGDPSMNTLLLEVDSDGLFAFNGSVNPNSLRGPDWYHFSYGFNLLGGDAAPLFEFNQFSGLGISEANIDNVSFNSVVNGVPEPGMLILLGSGLLGLAVLKRKSLRSDNLSF